MGQQSATWTTIENNNHYNHNNNHNNNNHNNQRLSQWDNNLQPGKPFKTTIIIIITITITITIITITIIIINDYQSGTTICNLHNY